MTGRSTNLWRLSAYGLLAVVVLAAAVYLFRAVPFDLASYLAWAGIGTTFFGLVSIVRPLRFLGIPTRARGGLVAIVGILVTTVCVFWPVSVRYASGEEQRLDAFLSEYQFSEYHEALVWAPRREIEEAIRQVSFADMPLADLLMRIRALAGGGAEGGAADPTPILELMTQTGTGFLPLDVSDPSELVYGMVGKPWSNEPPPPVTTPEEFLVFDEPGNIRVAFNLRVVEEGDGAFRVTTETRTLGNDPRARRVFGRYWRIIYPGSAIIRKVWLDAIVSRAEL
jgi:hypothetical protein